MSKQVGKPGIVTRLLSGVCVGCPFCIARRAWPKSWYGRTWGKLGRICPFCRAYDRQRARTQPAE